MADVIIVGNGPAGISAALYTIRSGLDTLIIGRDFGALTKAEKIENYYGFELPIRGEKLIHTGILQAKRLGAKIKTDEVVGLTYQDQFLIKTKTEELNAKSIILATGSPRSKPKITGLEALEGKGISYCASCDAFFYKGKDVAVLGCCDYARSEVMELLHVVKSVTLVTNGEEPISDLPADLIVNTKKILRLEGNTTLSNIIFEDESALSVNGLFVAVGVAGSSDLAKKLGAQINGSKIVVDENMSTSIPGLFAAGDCTGGMLQIAKAVYEGAKAGMEAIKFIRKSNSVTEKS